MTKPERAIILTIAGTFIVAAVVLSWWQATAKSQDRTIRDAQSARASWVSSNAAQRANKPTRQQQVDALYQKIVDQHPEMAVTWKQVPDKENGFLQWMEFQKKHADGLALPDDVKDILNRYPEKWDAARIGQWLKENKTLMDEIAAIGMLPDQSARGIELPANNFLNAQLPYQCAKLLCLQSRWEAEQGKPTTNTLQAAMGLANHLDQIETPSLLHVSVAALLRQTSQAQFFKYTLPNLPADADLSAWQQTLHTQYVSPAEYSHVLRGDWHTSLRYYALPNFLENDPKLPSDPEAFLEAATRYTKQRMDACATADWEHLQEAMNAVRPSTNGLSEISKYALNDLHKNSASYTRSYLRNHSTQTLQAAAFAHLRGEPLPNEPITGLPYVWDASNKTLSAPNDPRLNAMQLKSIQLPR